MDRNSINRTIASLAAFCLAVSAVAPPTARGQGGNYARSTAIVYNKNVPGSKDLADFYATSRNIPKAHLIGLNCPKDEAISRGAYEADIKQALRTQFTNRGWWKLKATPASGVQAVENQIRLLVLMHGMPLTIKHEETAAPAPPAAGKPAPAGVQKQMKTNAASVDSELTLLGAFSMPTAGYLNNPYFKKNQPFYLLRVPAMMMVGRIDGPSPKIARRMITDAIEAERTGLWGRAYLDKRGISTGGLALGDAWLTSVEARLRSEGIPVVVDSGGDRFPLNYPMDDAALYFGWYSAHRDGPLLNKAFRFRTGAVACHIHSFSAQSIRTATAHWVGPLLDRGAAAALGNVAEPFLHATAHLDIFTDRLLDGYTLAESAHMATPFLSWMTMVAGDPLYRPYYRFSVFDKDNYSKDSDRDWKAVRLAVKRWAQTEPVTLKKKLMEAAVALSSGVIFEELALRAFTAKETGEANVYLKSAMDFYRKPSDKIRIALHQAASLERAAGKDAAATFLDAMLKKYPTAPEASAIKLKLLKLKPAASAPRKPAPKPAPVPKARPHKVKAVS